MVDPPSRLLLGERVLWEGAPPRGLVLRARDAFVIPFTFLWAAFALVFNITVWTSNASWFFCIWGLPFLLVGAYISVGRLIHDARARRRLRYFVTDRRVLVVRRGWGLRSLSIDRLPFLEAVERRDGSGDLRFEAKRYYTGKRGRLIERDQDAPALSTIVQFLGIPNVAAVRALIEEAALAARSRLDA